jgi:7,8-dihydropterin-6-yl-methyl-4-(beta-D-ribofuranosyl)aminobenzene 5'-phosphate synthase
MQITILTENYAAESDLAEWGFSALIEHNGQRLLFDTGYTGQCLLKNAQQLKISLEQLDAIVLSHGHNDHTGGLDHLLQVTTCRKIYAHPQVFMQRFSRSEDGELEDISFPLSQSYYEQKYGAQFYFSRSWQEILPDIFMTGEVSMHNSYEQLATNLLVKNSQGELVQDQFPDDNSLVVRTKQGMVIIFGCAHRGIVNIMQHCKEQLDIPIYAIVGGMHLYRATEEHYRFVREFLQNNTVKQICPGHCTGMQRIFDLQNSFPQQVEPAFCGHKLCL